VDHELREAFDRLDAKIEAKATELRGEMAALGADMRRHFDVVGEFIRGDVRAIAEGLALSNQRTDQRFGEQSERSDRLEGRVLGLEVRVSLLEEGGKPRRARRPRS
jgi:hypothetical protein